MSKTTQENKAKKAKETKVEVLSEVEGQKAVDEVIETTSETTEEVITIKKVAKQRSKKYLAAKKKIDVTKYYELEEAIKLVKETSLSKFEGKIEAHVTVIDMGNVGEISFPHMETTSKKIVILNEAVLAELKEGNINFDILVATPSTMPKLLPLAKLLGPKGLMPNPKVGTLTDKPEEAVKKLSVAKTIVKTEKKAPVIHMIVGKNSQKDEEVIANVNELIKVIKANKIKKFALCATIGPCVKVKIVA